MCHPSMVTLANPSPSPTSIQLRFGLLCRNSAHAPLRVRFWKSGIDRRCRGFLVRRLGVRNGKERHSSSTHHVLPVDSFSGWLEDDSDGDGDGDGDSGEKKGHGGILGAGLAGMFLTASVAFASISMSGKRSIACSGMKQQMKPLTSQQEVLLCSDDDQNDKASLVEDKSNSQLTNCGVEIPKSDILDDSISESSLSVKQTEFQANSSPSEDLPGDPDSKCSYSESLLPNSSVVTELKDLTEMDDIATTNISELSSYSRDVADLNSGNQDDGSTPSEVKSSKVSNKASSQLSSETLDIDTLINSESNATLDPQPSNDLSHQADIDLGVTHELENEEINKSLTGTILTMDEKEVLLVKETITSSLDQSSLTGIGLPEANKESDSDKIVETISSLSPSDSVVQNSSFSHAGIPAPSVVSPALQVPLGKVMVPAVIDQIQGHAFSAMQVLKVIEGDVQPCDICTRRQYARWLVSASGAHSRNTISKVYPAMYIENMTELAFDDVTPDDPDFSCIQGLAEAGLISSKLTLSDTNDVKIDEMDAVLFSPESPLSRQDLVCWAVVGSQAVITGTFSIIKQCTALGCFPRVKIIHTSSKVHGQIYIPEINWILMILSLAVTVGFRDTKRLGNAVGLAVITVMLVTTCLMSLVIILCWNKSVTIAICFVAFFGTIESLYFSASLIKFREGAWLPITLSIIFMLIMYSWHYGSLKKYEFDLQNKVSIDWILGLGPSLGIVRVNGIGLISTDLVSGIPAIFSHFVTNLPAFHQVLVFLCVKSVHVPYVQSNERFLVGRIGPREYRLYRCIVRYGYHDIHKDDVEFEKDLVCSIAEFIQSENSKRNKEVEDASQEKMEVVPCRIRLHEDDEIMAAGPSEEQNEIISTEKASPIITPRKKKVRFLLPPGSPKLDASTSKELQELSEAREAGVAFIASHSHVRAKRGSGLLKKLAINFGYDFLSRNSRGPEGFAMNMSGHANTLEVGMVYLV